MEGEYFHVIQIKTSTKVVIPIHPVVKKIMVRRGDELPVYMHENKLNEQIKSICKRAKIDKPHKLSRTVGGKIVEYNSPKYASISTHSMRRSFCSNAYQDGMAVHDIMAISGHKSEKVFLNYVKVQVEENAKRIAQHKFFN